MEQKGRRKWLIVVEEGALVALVVATLVGALLAVAILVCARVPFEGGECQRLVDAIARVAVGLFGSL